MNPHDISVEDFSYSLPEERIPKYPLDIRDESKLLVYKNENIDSKVFKEIKNELASDTLLIFNDSRVIPVRLFFNNAYGAQIEVFCLEQVDSNGNSTTWKCFVGNLKKWREDKLVKTIDNHTVEIKLQGREADHVLVSFSWSENIDSIYEVFERFGSIPIPPYLKRDTEEIDKERYQNVFAHHKGSVAAPTAGLHFNKPLIEDLKAQGIGIDFVTLHVGAGTFKPVKSDTIGGHQMHMERILVTKDFVERIKEQISNEKKITAVGTTTLRTLESLYWLGNKLSKEPTASLNVNQWEPYEESAPCSVADSLEAIIKHLESKQESILSFSTELLILPSYKFNMIDSIVTNFHQPKSTLLLLIAAATGDHWKSIYDFAMINDYRFLSYGDSSLLFLSEEQKAR